VTPDPFAALGLPASQHLTDEQVHAAWRTIATATHPDRPDGGDPARYAQASAARDQLSSQFGRTEALADLGGAVTPDVPARDRRHADTETGTVTVTGTQDRTAGMILNAARAFPRRVRHGRPARIAARAAIAAAVAWVAVTFSPGIPAAPAVAAGCALWFILTSRHDLAPPAGR
jgi:hypothetical protein